MFRRHKHAQLRLFRAWHRTGPFAPGDEERAFSAQPDQTLRQPAQGDRDRSGKQELAAREYRPQQLRVVVGCLFRQGRITGVQGVLLMRPAAPEESSKGHLSGSGEVHF